MSPCYIDPWYENHVHFHDGDAGLDFFIINDYTGLPTQNNPMFRSMIMFLK